MPCRARSPRRPPGARGCRRLAPAAASRPLRGQGHAVARYSNARSSFAWLRAGADRTRSTPSGEGTGRPRTPGPHPEDIRRRHPPQLPEIRREARLAAIAERGDRVTDLRVRPLEGMPRSPRAGGGSPGCLTWPPPIRSEATRPGYPLRRLAGSRQEASASFITDAAGVRAARCRSCFRSRGGRRGSTACRGRAARRRGRRARRGPGARAARGSGGSDAGRRSR